jgi:hypothetical protein
MIRVPPTPVVDLQSHRRPGRRDEQVRRRRFVLDGRHAAHDRPTGLGQAITRFIGQFLEDGRLVERLRERCELLALRRDLDPLPSAVGPLPFASLVVLDEQPATSAEQVTVASTAANDVRTATFPGLGCERERMLSSRFSKYLPDDSPARARHVSHGAPGYDRTENVRQ